MADNVTMNPGSGGVKAVSAEFSFSGDTAHAFGGFGAILSGSEGSWTYTLLEGGAGAVTAGVQRITLASDDPAVALLGTIDTDTGAIATSASSIDGKITACNTGAVVVSSSALPTGAATAAKQPALGTAGTASADVITVQGIASMTPVTVTLSSTNVTNAGTFAVQAAQSGTWNITNISGTVSLPTGASTLAEQQTQTTALQLIDDAIYVDDADWSALSSKHALIGGLYQATPGTITDGDTGPLRVDANGSVRIHIAASSITQTISGTVTANAGTNLNTSALALETGGNLAAATTALQIIDDWDESDRCKVNPIAGQAGVQGGSGTVTALTQRVVLATDVPLPAGTNAIGKLSANSGVDIGDVDVLSIAAGTNTIGDVGLIGRTSGGLTLSRTISAASTNATSVKGSAGQVFWVYCTNTNASARFLKFYNKASAPTVGTDTPVLTLLIPGNTAGAGFHLQSPLGLVFGTGIAFALTTGVADADTGAVAANEIVVNLGYK